MTDLVSFFRPVRVSKTAITTRMIVNTTNKIVLSIVNSARFKNGKKHLYKLIEDR